MLVPLQITVRDVQHSEALETRIREKAAKLETLHPGITSCRVTVEAAHRHHHQGRQFQVRIDLRVPGKELVASRDHDEDPYVALREAFDALRRQLDDLAGAQRAEARAAQPPAAGET
jgi:ribosomal subunit interface protein